MQLRSFFIISAFLGFALANSYILVFEQGQVTPNKYVNSVKDKVLSLGGTIKHEYNTVLTGFAFSVPDIAIVDSIKLLSDPKYPFFIEKDSTVHAYDEDL